MSNYPQTGLPGMSAGRSSEHRRLMFSEVGKVNSPGFHTIDGSKSADIGNTGNVRTIRAGKVMGKITSSGKWAPSIIGTVRTAYDGSTTLTTVATGALATELVRRIGSTGTFKVTGPATAGGTVRTLTLTYSNANTSSGDITVTAANVNEVQTLNFTNSPSGTFRIGIYDYTGKLQYTQPITYSATPATLVSNINTALDAVLASGAVVASGSAVTAIALTFSGTNYAATAQTNLVLIDTDALTAGDVDITRTTTGVDGRFIAGAYIQPTDGSEDMRLLVGDGWGIPCTDIDLTSEDQNWTDWAEAICGGIVDDAQIIDLSSDTALLAYTKAQLRLRGVYIFSTDIT